MQLLSAAKYDQREGDVAPLHGVIGCTQLEEEAEATRIVPTHTPQPPTTSHSVHHPHHVVPSGTSSYDIPGNTRKRKCDEVESNSEEERRITQAKVRQYLQLRRRLLLSQRKLVKAGQTGLKLPLCYVFSDLLLHLPRLSYVGNGGQGRGRRKSHMPDLSTPIDSSHPLEAQVPKTPPLYHVQESLDSLSLEGSGFSEEWFTNILQDVTKDLNKYGVCVVDDFLGEERADRILEEVRTLHSLGVMQAGQVVSQHVQDQARGKIRGDKITWVTGDEPHCSSIGQLVNVVDYIVAKANKHYDAGKLAQYNITWRTRAMVACYPGCDTHYVKHVDNPNGDGRCITAIYYLNKNWTPNDGGVLRIYPENCSDIIASINPCFDRMLFFWSDRRNPHEVMPAKIVRYAITVWYLDQKEREEYLARE
ncbi:uncharacterized protein LOC135113107 isoform X1 [Scylla paramamosain]|uniref:uncharacterized protein LOC135113107 isoform X1 n=1 Tax=Scylla paramamosain TaxID=85552 RepID=UPI003083CF23